MQMQVRQLFSVLAVTSYTVAISLAKSSYLVNDTLDRAAGKNHSSVQIEVTWNTTKPVEVDVSISTTANQNFDQPAHIASLSGQTNATANATVPAAPKDEEGGNENDDDKGDGDSDGGHAEENGNSVSGQQQGLS